MENQKLIPVMDLIKNSFEIYKERVWVLLGLLGITFLSFLAVLPGMIIFWGVPKNILGETGSSFIGFILFLIGIIFCAVIGIWCQIASVYAVKERASKIGIKQSLAMAWPKFWSFVWVGILVAIVVFVGFCLLVVPGIIFLVWFYIAAYVLVVEDIKGTDALKRSKQLVAGYWWPVFGRILLLCLASMVLSWIPIIGFIIIIFFLAPFDQVYNYLMYEDIKRVKSIA